MDRRGFFSVPLAAVVAGTACASQKLTTGNTPKSGDIMKPPAGALEVVIDGKTYHLYLFEPIKR